MSSFNRSRNTVENSPLPEDSLNRKQLLLQCNLIQSKKKPADVKGAQHSMDLSFQSDGSAEAQLTTDTNKKHHNDVSKQKTIGPPVIVDALSEDFSLLSIPEIFKRQGELARTKNNVFNSSRLHMSNMRSEASVIVAESLNSNSSYSQRKDTNVVSPSKNSCKLPNDKKQLQSNDCDTSSPKKHLASVGKAKKSDVCEGNSGSVVNNIQDNTFKIGVSSHNETLLIDQQPIRFYCLQNKVAVVMSKNARFCFTGKLIVQVIYGAIEVYGYVITAQNNPIEIYSPRGYSNVSMKASEKFSQNVESDIWVFLSKEGIDQNQENKLVDEVKQIKPGMTIVLLSNLENKLTRFLRVFYPFKLFPEIKSVPYYSWIDTKRAERILQSNLYVDNQACKEIIVDPCVAEEVADKILTRWNANEWSSTLIAGGKGVGKSTTMRYLINSLLPVSKIVVLLDVDPGQTECTPAGCISYSLIEKPLMGPNFTHLKTPAFQVYIGDVNVSRCITRYIEGIKMLVDKLSSCPVLSRLPIVINTMGFSQGIGWDIILFTIKLIRPSFVVQIMSEKPKNNYIEYLSKQVVNRQQVSWPTWGTNVTKWNQPCDHELFVVPSHAESKSAPGYETWNMEPYQQRELVMISYLSEIVQNSADSATRYDSLSLSINEVTPYVTPLASLCISIPQASVSPSHVLNVINGNIVALCGIDVNNNELQADQIMTGPRILNRSPLCACYGFGIIRGLDMERQQIFINTPLPISTLQYVNCLMGCIPVPTTLLQTHQFRNVPYTGGNDVLPMSREHRRGYFRMRYQRVQNNA